MLARENIEGLALPFAAGVAAGVFGMGNQPFLALYPAACAAFCLAVAGIYMSLRNRTFLCLSLMMFFTGTLCALTALAGGSGSTQNVAGAYIPSGIFPHESTGALVKAMLGGDRALLDGGTVAIFRSSGASHLLALSGLHLGIIYMILDRLLIPLGNTPAARAVKYGVKILLCGAYAYATGASASISRAFLFILLWETSRISCRRPRPMTVWCGALTIQLTVAPLAIRSAGFLLSYMAMAGIFVVYPWLKGVYPSESRRFDPIRKIWEAACVAISCQLFTAPLAWVLFGTFPKYFLLTNLLAMPLTTAFMVLSVATVLLTAAGCCPSALIQATDALCQLLLTVLEIIAGM